MKILLLEDDVILNELIEEYLLELSYKVDVCFDGYEAQDKAYSSKYDLFILDVNVPNISGFEILKQLRENKNNTPAIFITSLHTSANLQEGFNCGADDYIRKPFELEELALRINNLKRLYKIDNTNTINISKNIDFDTSTNNLIVNKNNIHISKKEAMVLHYFLNNVENVISIEELCANIWDYENQPSDATIRTYIKNIRANIGEDCITNIKGVGYRFNKI
jgi:two-component system OmpR family response regulator